MICVRDILAEKAGRTLTVAANAPVYAAVMLMNEQKTDSLLVVRDNALVGIFSERDVLLRAVAGQRDLQATRIEEVMAGDVVFCRPQTTLAEARSIMSSRRVRDLLVVAEPNEVMGIVSISDLNACQPNERAENHIDLVSFGDVQMFMYATDELYELLNPASKGQRPDLFNRHTNTQGFAPSWVRLEDLENTTNPRHVAYLLVAHLWKMDLDFTVLDIGAHAGLFSLKLANFFRSCSKANKVRCFEPGSIGELTQFNISINGLHDYITLERLAIADFSGPTLFSETRGHTDAAQLVAQSGGTKLVSCKSLSSYLSEHSINNNLLIKIDTEGVESAIISNIERVIDERYVTMFLSSLPRFRANKRCISFWITWTRAFIFLMFFMPLIHRWLSLSRLRPEESFLKKYRDGGPHPNLDQFRRGTAVHHTDILAVPKKLPAIGDLLGRMKELSVRQVKYWYDA